MPENKVLVGISVGDVHGIGVEIIMDAFTKSNLLDKCIPIVFCPHQVFLAVSYTHLRAHETG